MNVFVPGQRWMSESEPELGLGTVVPADPGRVKVEFKAAGETRIYAVNRHRLNACAFAPATRFVRPTDQELVVKEVLEQRGLLIYVGENQRLPEAQLSDHVSFQGPQERLFAGRFDALATFALRRRSLELLHRSRQSSGAGVRRRAD